MPPVPDWLNDWWEHDHCKPPEFCYHPSADREYLLRKMCTIPGDSAPRRDMYRIDDYRNRIANLRAALLPYERALDLAHRHNRDTRPLLNIDTWRQLYSALEDFYTTGTHERHDRLFNILKGTQPSRTQPDNLRKVATTLLDIASGHPDSIIYRDVDNVWRVAYPVRDVTLTDRHGTSHDFGTFIVTHYVYYSTYGDDHVSLETKVYGNGNPNTAYPEYSHPHVANAGPCTGAANRDFMLNQIRSGLGFGVPAIMDNMLRSYNYMDAFRPLETWDEELPEDEICEYCEATLDGDDYCLVTCHETGRSGCSSCFIYSEDNDAYYHPDECEPTEYYSHPSNRWRAGRYVPTGQVISCVDCDRPMEDDPYLVPPIKTSTPWTYLPSPTGATPPTMRANMSASPATESDRQSTPPSTTSPPLSTNPPHSPSQIYNPTRLHLYHCPKSPRYTQTERRQKPWIKQHRRRHPNP